VPQVEELVLELLHGIRIGRPVGVLDLCPAGEPGRTRGAGRRRGSCRSAPHVTRLLGRGPTVERSPRRMFSTLGQLVDVRAPEPSPEASRCVVLVRPFTPRITGTHGANFKMSNRRPLAADARLVVEQRAPVRDQVADQHDGRDDRQDRKSRHTHHDVDIAEAARSGPGGSRRCRTSARPARAPEAASLPNHSSLEQREGADADTVFVQRRAWATIDSSRLSVAIENDDGGPFAHDALHQRLDPHLQRAGSSTPSVRDDRRLRARVRVPARRAGSRPSSAPPMSTTDRVLRRARPPAEITESAR